MPLRSPKMKRRIFGFQRRVWWPKWTPASSSCFMVTTATGSLPRLYLGPPRPSRGTDDRGWRACEFSERAVTRARVAVSVPEACSRQPLGLDPVGPREPHREDQAPRAHAEPDREAAGVETPDDPTRLPVEDHDPPAVGPEDDGVRREDHTGLEDRHPERGLPPGRAAPGVDERDRPEVVADGDVAAGCSRGNTRVERCRRRHRPALRTRGDVTGHDAGGEVAVALAEHGHPVADHRGRGAGLDHGLPADGPGPEIEDAQARLVPLP